MKIFFTLKRFVVCCLLLLSVNMGFGQPQFLDQSFGNGGKVISATNDSTHIRQVKIQPDGKIIASCIRSDNRFCLVRYNSNGTPDSTFGVDGFAINYFCIPVFGFAITANALELQPDGKILAAGTGTNNITENDRLLVRYNPNGTIDSSFGINGQVFTDIGIRETNMDVLLRPDGKIITAGYNDLNNNPGTGIIVQYTTDGKRDSSFGTNGVVYAPKHFDTFQLTISRAILQNDNKIVCLGKAETSGIAFRYLPTGVLDSTFGHFGMKKLDSIQEPFGINLQPDGKLVFTGHSFKKEFRLIRLDDNGSPDSSFGSNGLVKAFFEPTLPYSYARSAAILPNTNILIAGTASNSNLNATYNEDFILMKIKQTGQVDSTFGINGIIKTDFGAGDNIFSIIVQNDGKIVAGGGTFTSAYSRNIALARYSLKALPVHLLTFTARLQDKKILLNWTVENEQFFDRYEVERSYNGSEFNKIGSITAINAKAYNYTDNNLTTTPNTKPQTIYYRLKLIDKDGKFTYSKIEKVLCKNQNTAFSIFPNPAHNSFQLQLNNAITGKIMVEITDVNGKIMMQKVYEASSNITVSTNKLSAGAYTVKVFNDSKQYSQTLIVNK